MFRLLFGVLPFLLSGCGVSVLAHNEYITFSDVEAKAHDRQVFDSEGLYFRKVFTNNLKEYEDEKKEFVVHNVSISFSEYDGGLVGLFPLIPPPPFIPVFYDNIDVACPIKSDTMMTIRHTTLEDEQKIDEFIRLADKDKITLTKENNEVIRPRHIWSDGYVYHVCFPLSAEGMDNMVLNIRGLVNTQGCEINFLPQLLHYYKDYIFVMAYLGGEAFGKTAEK